MATDRVAHDAAVAKLRKELEQISADFPEIYKESQETLAKKWGFNPKERDIIWGVSNRMVIEVRDKSSVERIGKVQKEFLAAEKASRS